MSLHLINLNPLPLGGAIYFADSTPGLKLWFDATDVNGDGLPDTSDDFINGNRVSIWADKSGNTNNPVQANVLRMPTWTPFSLNKKATLQFNSDFNQIFDIQNEVTSPNFIFIVHRHEDSNPSNILGGDLRTASTDGYLSLEHGNGNVAIVSESNSSNWSVSSLRVAPNSQSLWINGQIIGADSYADGVLAIDHVGENFSGEIAEALIFEDDINSISRQKIEGYLAHKWGFNEELPHLHPYSAEPPAFGGDQEIVWGGLVSYVEDNATKQKLPDRALGDPAFELVAYASSGLPVSFVSSDSSILAIVGNIAYINGVGEVTISAIQMGDTRYHPALPQHQELKVIHPVVKDDQLIVFDEIDIKVRDDEPFELNASATSGLPLEFQVDFGPATVNSFGIVSLDGLVGTVSITVAQGGSAYFNPAVPVTRTFEVSSKQRPLIIFLTMPWKEV